MPLSSGYALPISVVIPHVESRRDFLLNEALPSVLDNRPSEVIIESGSRSAQKKRNDGAEKATQPFVFFHDDDVKMRSSCLEKMLIKLRENEKAGFVYCDFERVIHGGITFPYKSGVQVPGPSAVGRLRNESPICTMSLIRKEAFPGFDERIRREQDRDLFLGITKAGWGAEYIADVLIELHQIDQISITQTVPQGYWHIFVSRKYGYDLDVPLPDSEWGAGF